MPVVNFQLTSQNLSKIAYPVLVQGNDYEIISIINFLILMANMIQN